MTTLDFTRVNSDVNGNPRYVVHFLECEPKTWKDYPVDLTNRYSRVCTLMNRIGGRKFHNKQYGGGIVFQSYSIDDTERHILRVIGEIDAQGGTK